MLHISDTQLIEWISAFLYPFLRIGGFVMAAPVIGTRAVPARVRIVLVLALCLVVVPTVPTFHVDPLDARGVLTGAHQIIIGATIGLILRLVFFVFEFAGQLVSQQTGLGFASLVDPQTGAQVPVLAHFYIIIATLLFFAIDAHLVLIKLLAQSFYWLPIGPQGLSASGADVVLEWSAQLFAAGLVLGLPIVIALLAINFALGVMARAAPQLNIFAVGFPLMILFGMVLVMLTMDSLVASASGLFDGAFLTARQTLEAR